MGAETLIYHPSVSHYIKFVGTTVGRDKLLRLVQFFARFYAWYLLRTDAVASRIAPWDSLKKQLGIARKFLRVGKNIEHLKLAAHAADPKNQALADPVLRYTTVGRQLGYAGYLTLDSITILDAAGVRKWDRAKTLAREANRFWVLGLTFSIVGQLYTQYRLNQREARIDRKDGEGVVESKRIAIERAASRLQLITDLSDLTIPTTALGLANFDDGFIGLAGTLSSIIGIYIHWKKTA
ncbi:hypothetical protein S7711_03257 [Stachybotrys chartarum IBT 7711]|uniref:Peroxisomal membrane protein PMP27 n=1 Tax=Stachybotrys chartarum (strain CBS 109288 / IBT 7711) TaxID=1280523 RepID=A0A084AZN2_STACB|nr:hypothetical protein S7711_03257 [Stachybotrys chartarum IBT 7711]KFA50961.1 hypothetical protein S40293_02428 [Stachybotrys chartarum IBT 40293]KFA76271.1 hypothetical protein S40288_03616 [Stachybotrys chartarum IBT 40288]